MTLTRKDYPAVIEAFLALPADQRKGHMRNLARTDLFFLLVYILKREDVDKEWLFARCQEVQASPDGHLDLWAREHYKSTIITFAKTIQDVLVSHGDNPLVPREVTIGIFSHTRPSAKAFLKQIKQEFENNSILKDLFPDIFFENPAKEAPKWSEDEGISVKRRSNPKEQTIEAWGLVDGMPTGKHFVKLVYDDVVTRESVTTPEMIKKTTEALELSYNLGSDGGSRRFIGTRYHFNDSYSTLLSRGTATPRIYPATKDGTVEGDPVLLSAEALAQKRRDMGPYIFGCQMLQNPKADEAQGFKQEWMQFYDSKPDPKQLAVYLLFDPASGKKKTNDYTVGWAIGLGYDRKVRILDMVRDRLNLPERAALVFKWHKMYKPVRQGIRYERYGLQADVEHFKTKMDAEHYDFMNDIVEVGGSTPKNDRIKRLIPYFEQGKILFPRSFHYTDYQKMTRDLVHDFIHEEYLPFPVPVHDDMLDALARLLEPDLELLWPKEKSAGDYDDPGKASGFNFNFLKTTAQGWMS